MLPFRVLACVAMIPCLVTAERFSFGGCGWYLDPYTADHVFTQQGLRDLFVIGAQMPTLYYRNPSEPDEEIDYMRFGIFQNLGRFSLLVKPKSSARSWVQGNVTYVQDPIPKLELVTNSEDFSYEGVFGFDANGVADLYPLYISDTDLILKGCRGVFLGRQETLYVLSNQDYWKLDSECAAETLKEMTGFDTVPMPNLLEA